MEKLACFVCSCLIGRAGIEPTLEAEPLPAHSLLPSLLRGRMCLYSLVWVYNLCHLGIGIQRGRETKSPGLVGGWGDQVPMTREVSDKCQGVVWRSWDKLTAYVDLQQERGVEDQGKRGCGERERGYY